VKGILEGSGPPRCGVSRHSSYAPVRTPTFHLLPKVHKPGNPGKPTYNSHTEQIFALVDSFLQPHVQALPAYIGDIYHLWEIIRKLLPLPSDILLCTINVTSLYTNIPHAHGLAALEFFLNKKHKLHNPTTAFLLNMVNLVLTCNNFTFDDKHYLQIRGTVMGTRIAPSYANLFMGKLEHDFQPTQPLTPLLWIRFLDDILMLWSHGKTSSNTFLEQLNQFHVFQFT